MSGVRLAVWYECRAATVGADVFKVRVRLCSRAPMEIARVCERAPLCVYVLVLRR